MSSKTISPEIGCSNPIFPGRFLVSFSAPGFFGVSALDWGVPTRSFPLSVTTSPHDFVAIGGFGRIGTSQSNPIFISKQPTVFPRVGRDLVARGSSEAAARPIMDFMRLKHLDPETEEKGRQRGSD